jgi:hypothetical protein
MSTPREVLFEPRDRVRRTNGRRAWRSLAASVGFLAVGVLGPVPMGFVGWILAVLVASGFALRAALGGRTARRLEGVEVETDETALTIAAATGPIVWPRKRITGGFLEEVGDGRWSAVLVRDDHERCVVNVDDRDEAETLLAWAGVRAAERVARFPLRNRASNVACGELTAVLALVILSPLLFEAIAMIFALFSIARKASTNPMAMGEWALVVSGATAAFGVVVRWLVQSLAQRELVVGTDGVRISGSGGRFIPYSEIDRVEPDANGVALVLRGEKKLILPTMRDAMQPMVEVPYATLVHTKDMARRDAVIARIQEAMEARGEGASAAAAFDASVLDRNGRELSAWREELRTIAQTVRGAYRTSGDVRDRLIGVVEDGTQPAGRRIAAAVALEGDEEARKRVRIAVDACADKELRAALEAAAEGEADERVLSRFAPDE